MFKNWNNESEYTEMLTLEDTRKVFIILIIIGNECVI